MTHSTPSELAMNWLGRLLFGPVVFVPSEEYLEFQYKFLCVLILAGALLTAIKPTVARFINR